MLRAKHLWRLHIGIRKTYPEYSSLWRPVSTCTESGRLMILNDKATKGLKAESLAIHYLIEKGYLVFQAVGGV